MHKTIQARVYRRARHIVVIWGALAAAQGATGVAHAQALEEIIVTAQRREESLQTTPIAISAYSGAALAENKIFTVADLANSTPAFSLTAGTPLDVELNIRGITNTRLDAPSADPSVGTFLDGVYVGRTGDLNFDFYDLERIEIIRGPQGVLLGKNVVGGAMSVITAGPQFEPGGEILASYGNYSSTLVTGHVTGGLTDSLAGRFSFQARHHDGYARDILHNRDVEDLDSLQGRAQLLYEPGDSTWRVRGIIDYMDDSTNGINVVAVDGGTTNCEQTYLRSNCTRPWSNLRRYLGITDPRKNIAQSVQYAGEDRINQFFEREAFGLTLDIEKDFSAFAFNSLTGYRDGSSHQLYDQTGAGPEALGWSVAEWQKYTAFVAATRPVGNGSNGLFLFAEPVNEETDSTSLSQEFRLTSTNTDSRWDWIAGVYYKSDEIDKIDHFIGETFLGGPLATLSGETRWVNNGENTTYAGFGQVGFKFTDRLKLSVGARYTKDEKEGRVSGFAIATGDRFNPADPRALTPLESRCYTPAGAIVPAPCLPPNRWVFAQGTGYDTPYSEEWSKLTPQAILTFTQSDSLYLYATIAEGFKGGGFDDTPSSAISAQVPFDPEEVINYELGFKANLLDRRMRLNASVFFMDYTDLQVTQTNAACLCNLTDNAASAEIKGIEAEFEYAFIDSARIFLSGSFVDTEYVDFLESATIPGTNPPQRLDSSGNRLQRTPETQVSGGVDISFGAGDWEDALNFRVMATYQGDLYWATDNIAKEESYTLLDARVALAPAGAPWVVSVFGKNLTDELYRVNIIPFFGEEVSQFGAPRTYGVDLSWRF